MMLVHPKAGQRVELRYRPSMREWGGLHGARGTVEIVAKGPGPRNHQVLLDYGRRVAVPCGNLRKEQQP